MPAESAVEVRDVVFRYDDKAALAGISFDVPSASIFGLLGPNGSGKTTLFRILSTLLVPEDGSIKIFGIDVVKQPLEARKQIGVVFQSQSLDNRLTIQENLVHQGHMYGMRGEILSQRIDEVLERVRLTDRRKERIATLSGGLRRRADLAKGLLHSPRLLLLDEPSTGVDPNARLAFWQYLEELRASESVTVLLTTHLMDEASGCDHLVILDEGHLIREGTPSELTSEVGGEVVVLVTSTPAEIISVLNQQFSVQDVNVDGNVIRFEHPEAAKWAVKLMHGFEDSIESVKISKPSLEDVFIHHTGHGFENNNASLNKSI